MNVTTRGAKQAAVLALLLLVGVVGGAPPAEGQQGSQARTRADQDKVEEEHSMPPGQGRELILRACQKCHHLGFIVWQRKTAADWRRTVDEMIRLGTSLTADEAGVVRSYLATRFGPQALTPDAHQPALAGNANNQQMRPGLPEGEGRALIFQACVQCHDLGIIVRQRRTVADWRRSVNEMIWRGAPLTADEVDVLTNYLAAWLGG